MSKGKQKPYYKLIQIKELAVLRRNIQFSNRVLEEIENLGLDIDSAVDLILKLDKTDYIESRSAKKPPVDIYKISFEGVRIYIKFGILMVNKTKYLDLVSFHEDRP